jgi:prepilin-type N-terminal cleavage/methylation domain-containing protein
LQAGASPRRRGGFTLLEVLVAVGAVAVVAAGLAVVFDSVGKTVSAGRRNSRVNQVAQGLQQQLSNDFGSMTREGFLVVRQSFADVDGSGDIDVVRDRVPMSDAESRSLSRARRVDELLFFQTGDFSTQRTPVVPGGDPSLAKVAKAGEAMVYFGHGNLWSTDLAVQLNVEAESLGANNPNRLGGPDGPSANASSWVLVRRQVLLTGGLESDDSIVGSYFDFAANDVALLDNECQVAGQPAAASVFRAMNRAYGPLGAAIAPNSVPQPTQYVWLLPLGANFADPPTGRAGPVLASGAIDIATTSLRELRSIVENFSSLPFSGDLLAGNAGGPHVANAPIAFGPGTPTALEKMRAWMDNAFPTASQDTVLDVLLPGEEETLQSRIRVAIEPPGLLANLDASANATNALERRVASVQRSDMQAVSSGSLISNCTEFVIEWTFGKVDSAGELVWHGPPRRGTRVAPYPFVRGGDRADQYMAQRTNDGLIEENPLLEPATLYGEAVPDVALSAWTRATLTSTFGFREPSFDPNVDSTSPTWGDPRDVPDLMEWPWPTQIRVRVSITDPLDPTTANEQTFEYVFAVPSARSAS